MIGMAATAIARQNSLILPEIFCEILLIFSLTFSDILIIFLTDLGFGRALTLLSAFHISSTIKCGTALQNKAHSTGCVTEHRESCDSKMKQ